MNKTTKKFLAAVAERAVKTFAQTFLAMVGATATNVFTATTLDTIKVSLSAALLSVVSSVASASFGPHGPSLASESVDAEDVPGH